MKKIIILIMLLMTISTYAQIDYPRYEKDSLGQSVVVLTIEQAQSLDSSTDILLLFEKLNTQIINYDSISIKVINEKEEVITKQTIQIIKLKEQVGIKDDIIKNLQQTIIKKDETINNLDKQVFNVQEQLSTTKKELKRTKTKMVIGGSLGGIVIIGLIYAILFP